MERKESEEQLVSTLGRMVMGRKSSEPLDISMAKNNNIIYAIESIVRSSSKPRTVKAGLSQLKKISESHPDLHIRNHALETIQSIRKRGEESEGERLSILHKAIRSQYGWFGGGRIFEAWARDHAIPNMKKIIKKSIKANDNKMFNDGMTYLIKISENPPSDEIKQLSKEALLSLKVQKAYHDSKHL